MRALTLVLAHRGASAARRENTVEAFLEARRLGSDGVELDVRLAADGAVVVHHDPALEGVGRISELRARDLPPWVPLLGEALDACAGMIVDVEVKNLPHEPDWDRGESLARTVAAQLADLGRTEDVIVSSFSPATLEAVRDADAAISTGWLTLRVTDPPGFLELATRSGCSALHPLHESVTTGLVTSCHEIGLAVNTWTVDDADRIRQLASAGVDAVITNRPEVATATLRGGGQALADGGGAA